MKVALCLSKDTIRAKYLLSCFEEGLRGHGDHAVWIRNPDRDQDALAAADVAIQVCTNNRHHGNVGAARMRRTVDEVCRRTNKRLLIIDTGFIKSQSWHETHIDGAAGHGVPLFDLDHQETFENVADCMYYEIGYDGLKRNGVYYNENSPSDRWEKLGVELLPWAKGGEYVLLIGQTRWGASTQHMDLFEWYRLTVRQIREKDDLPIVFRHHCRTFKREDRRAAEQRKLRDLGVTFSDKWLLLDDLADAAVAVVCSSNAAVESVVAGVPTIVSDPVCMAWDVAGHDVHQVVDPPKPDRTQWARNVAYAQWNTREMRDGTAWSHLRPHAMKQPSSTRSSDR